MDGYALNDIPRSGVENMALDQQMLETASKQQCALLRVYGWSEPTLSLGYFQPHAERLLHAPSSSLPVVRRATGGGAIVHHYDWTYCLAVPQQLTIGGAGSRRQPAGSIGASRPLYDLLHDAVVAWLQELGIAAEKWNSNCETDALPRLVDRQRPFLCFERRSCGDVVWGEHKLLGSAQRRAPGALLQHGSLLVASSPHAPELLGATGTPYAGPASMLAANRAASPNLQAEFFFQRLLQAIESATGIEFQQIPSWEESPLQWQWPQATHFSESNWTNSR